MHAFSIRAFAAALMFVCALVQVPADGGAATWRVEKDGSGDFEIIQDALDAAAPGDSILIGPGRFDTFRPGASVVDGVRFSAIAWVRTTGLTLIGAGAEQTLIGPPAALTSEQGFPACSLYIDGGAETEVYHIGFDNSFALVTIRERTVMEDCRTYRDSGTFTFAIAVLAIDVEIRRTNVVGRDGLITASGTRNLLVEDCLFEDPTLNGIQLVIGNGARDCMVRRTRFVGGGGGVQFSLGGTGWVEDCTFEGVRVAGIDVNGGSAIVRRCTIGLTRMGIAAGNGLVEVYDSVFEGGTQSTIFSTTTMYVRNCHILNAGGPTIRGRVSATGRILDVRENWWGTADEALIESWIDDEYGTVLWQPILTDAVSTEESSIGELKQWFRHEE